MQSGKLLSKTLHSRSTPDAPELVSRLAVRSAMNRYLVFESGECMAIAKVATLKSSAAVLFGLLFLTDVVAIAQNPSTKEELAAIEQAELTNQTKLSHYTWQEIQFVSVNGDAVDYRLYSVKIGANGQYQRNLVTEHTGEEATFEPTTKEQLSQYGPYAQQLCELANQYTSLNSEQLTRAERRGEIALVREDDLIKLTIKNYSKPSDSLTMTINQRTHRLVSVQAKSYLTEPQDDVTIQAEFAELPDGTNHVVTAEIDSVSKHLTVKLKNWSYQ
jgi:hypothetical protein